MVRDLGWPGSWAAEFSVGHQPQPVRHPQARPGELSYSVTFAEPQMDCEGCGPYKKASIWDRYLRWPAAGDGT